MGPTTPSRGSDAPYVRVEVPGFMHVGDAVRVDGYHAPSVTLTVRNLRSGRSGAATVTLKDPGDSKTVAIASPLFPDLTPEATAIDYFSIQAAGSGAVSQTLNFGVVGDRQVMLPPDLTNLRKVSGSLDLAQAIRDAWGRGLTLSATQGDGQTASSSYVIAGALPEFVVLRAWHPAGIGPSIYRPRRIEFTIMAPPGEACYLSELWVRP